MFKRLLYLSFLFISCTALAQSHVSQDWFWDLSKQNNFAFAATLNSQGKVLGQYCYFADNQCIYAVKLASDCQADKPQSAVLSTQTEKLAITLLCKQNQAFVLSPFDQVDAFIAKGGEDLTISLASDKKNTQNLNIHFSLRGAAHAIGRMHIDAQQYLQTQ